MRSTPPTAPSQAVILATMSRIRLRRWVASLSVARHVRGCHGYVDRRRAGLDQKPVDRPLDRRPARYRPPARRPLCRLRGLGRSKTLAAAQPHPDRAARRRRRPHHDLRTPQNFDHHHAHARRRPQAPRCDAAGPQLGGNVGSAPRDVVGRPHESVASGRVVAAEGEQDVAVEVSEESAPATEEHRGHGHGDLVDKTC